MGDFWVGRLDHHLALTRVDELPHLENRGRRPHIALLEPPTSCIFAVSALTHFLFGTADANSILVAHLLLARQSRHRGHVEPL